METPPDDARANRDECDEPKLAEPVSAHFAALQGEFPGSRALIWRRVCDPQLAADIFQDAAVTTLEKLRNGEIAHPENLAGYFFRVALNHLRNHYRKERLRISYRSASPPNEVPAEPSPDLDQRYWAEVVRQILDELPQPRDREILRRFYLCDEDCTVICEDLKITREHFSRVLFRARNRFRERLAERSLITAEFLSSTK